MTPTAASSSTPSILYAVVAAAVAAASCNRDKSWSRLPEPVTTTPSTPTPLCCLGCLLWWRCHLRVGVRESLVGLSRGAEGKEDNATTAIRWEYIIDGIPASRVNKVNEFELIKFVAKPADDNFARFATNFIN